MIVLSGWCEPVIGRLIPCGCSKKMPDLQAAINQLFMLKLLVAIVRF